ncbi:MAG: hypothetical protein V1781_08820 [Bacteroidota bacterium]
MKIYYLLSTYCLLIFFSSFSQSNQNISLCRENLFLYENYLNSAGCDIHTSIKPFNNTKEFEAINDSINPKKKHNNIFVNGIFASRFDHEKGKTSANNFELAGGLSFEGHIKEKLSFNINFLSGNSSFPSYIDTFITRAKVVPGIGSAYSSDRGYSYQYYSGYLSYSPNEIFNFQIGKDKHFFGDGYRSLFLSDVSNSFPFLKISTTIWKIKYVNLFACMKDVSSALKKDFLNKYGTFHYLSWNATKRINFALFESIIWQGTDKNRSRSFDVNYLSPIIFYRPTEYSLGSSDNSLLGFSFKVKIAKKQQLYGQLLLDEFLLKEFRSDIMHALHPRPADRYGWWGNKYGWQFGFKSFDIFKIKNLRFQTEVNCVRPYTYSHGSVQQNYANYNQPLAHPLCANFIESVSFLTYRYKRWLFENEFMTAIYGKDFDGYNMGHDIFLSYTTRQNDYGNYIGQGIKTNLFYENIRVAYALLSNLVAEAGVIHRETKIASSTSSTNFFYIGIKTNLMNLYND